MTNELTPNELLINLAGITYLYRDLLEAQSPNLKHKKKQLVNRLIVELNKDLNEIAKERDVWEELDKLQQYFHDNFVRESLDE